MRKLYKSCDTITVKRFFKIIENYDYRNLVIDFDDENPDFELTDSEILKYGNIFEGIFYDYSELSENWKLRSVLKKRLMISSWSFTYNLVNELVNMFINYNDFNCLDLINNLEDPNYKIDKEKEIMPQIKKIIHKLKGLKNRIKIQKIKVAEQLKTERQEVKLDLETDALYLERNLDLKREVDINTTTLSKWVKMVRMSREKSEREQKVNRRRNG